MRRGGAHGRSFLCFKAGNTQNLCQACGQDAGDYKAGYRYTKNDCARYCCTDEDCGTGSECKVTGINVDCCVVSKATPM